MTADQIIEELARCRRRNAQLRAHNTKLWHSNQDWHRRVEEHRVQMERLRTKVRDLRRSRDNWRAKAQAQPVRRPATANLELSRADIDRILGIPPRQ